MNDGQHILTRGGQRLQGVGPFDSREAADAERIRLEEAERKRLQETQGATAAPPIEVKQQING